MRYPAAHKEQTRRRIVRSAARQFRAHGDGVPIADLMRALSLTHGGFYRHFRSKDELYAEAFGYALEELESRVAAAALQAPMQDRPAILVDVYLSAGHAASPADGCPFAALASELARRPAGSRGPYVAALESHARRMAEYLPDTIGHERKATALALLSGMAGALNLARMLPEAFERDRFLENARAFYRRAASGEVTLPD